MERRRVTQQDIAHKAGVHRSTVTLALKNHPGIPAATRERILKVAEECGYARDPMLSALAAYSSHLKPLSYHGTIAWLINTRNNWDWRQHPHFSDYFEGAKMRARFHGYQLEIFDLNAPLMGPARLSSILAARNISGILLCPQPEPYTEMDLEWKSFSAVTFGYTLTKPRLQTVATAHYQNIVQAMKQLRSLGYQRIGYATPIPFNHRTNHECMAGYLMEEALYNPGNKIPPLTYDWRGYARVFVDWVKKHKLDAVLTMDTGIPKKLTACGLRAPDDIGVACFGLTGREDKWLTGIVENSPKVGEAALDWLVGMIQRGEQGLPQISQRMLIEGTWRVGESLRKVSN